ncbi:hypothetical protein JRQ81_005158 [Phrynocephalus forsythii]|uniref:Uncharacterized protein n=1 Tax=Phrynocephalus forsythii TaxID=171643 RepID=A0A9Q1B626_9SAUR|nr:hypothetical protein JRQ81_005158 [Phrynocephalus forsythii]
MPCHQHSLGQPKRPQNDSSRKPQKIKDLIDWLSPELRAMEYKRGLLSFEDHSSAALRAMKTPTQRSSFKERKGKENHVERKRGAVQFGTFSKHVSVSPASPRKRETLTENPATLHNLACT